MDKCATLSTDSGATLADDPNIHRAAALIRPSWILPYSSANVSAANGPDTLRRTNWALWHPGPRWFAPTNTSDPGPGGWRTHIFASQFPQRCRRYLLFEDDLKGQGFGYTLNFLTAALLMAISESRVLLEVPVDPTWMPLGAAVRWESVSPMTGFAASAVRGNRTWSTATKYSKTGGHRPAERPRWCSVPPFTLQCFYKPWTHCPRPKARKHMAPWLHHSWPYVIASWPPIQEDVVRIKLSWLASSWFLYGGKKSRKPLRLNAWHPVNNTSWSTDRTLRRSSE